MMTEVRWVRCGNNKVHGHPRSSGEHHHGSVVEVRACFAEPGGIRSYEEQHDDDSSRAEIAAEQANERWFEERGGGQYVGSQEEERDRYFDSLLEEQQALDSEAAQQAPSEPQTFIERFAAARAAEKAAPAQESPQEPAKADEVTPTQPVQQTLPGTEPDLDATLLDGTYTREREDGEHRTMRLRTQAPDAKFAPGKRVLSFLSGPDNEHDYTGFAFVNGRKVQVWSAHRGNTDLMADAQHLMAATDQWLLAAECRRCHRKLTVPSSIDAGLGPDCSKKA